MSLQTIITILTVMCTVLSLTIGFLTFTRNRDKEVKTETRHDAKIEARLEYISKGVDDIRIDQKANEKQMVALGERVTRVEESTKSLHKRVDSIEKDGC